MNEDRVNLLKEYIKSGVSPLLVQDIPSGFFRHSVVIKSDTDRSELNGHYEDIEFCPPLWYKKLVDNSKTGYSVLVIENINEISLEEQTKFIEILKYKKVSTFDLPKNCLVVLTCSSLGKNNINEEVYSLVAQI